MKSLWKELIILTCTAVTVFATLNCSNRVNLYDLQEVSVAANYEYNSHCEELWADYIDTQSVSSYNNVLGVITNNNIVITMLLTVCSIALIGYVLFGKR